MFHSRNTMKSAVLHLQMDYKHLKQINIVRRVLIPAFEDPSVLTLWGLRPCVTGKHSSGAADPVICNHPLWGGGTHAGRGRSHHAKTLPSARIYMARDQVCKAHTHCAIICGVIKNYTLLAALPSTSARGTSGLSLVQPTRKLTVDFWAGLLGQESCKDGNAGFCGNPPKPLIEKILFWTEAEILLIKQGLLSPHIEARAWWEPTWRESSWFSVSGVVDSDRPRFDSWLCPYWAVSFHQLNLCKSVT